MIDDCNINNLAKNQVSAIFHSRAIRRSVLPKFTEPLLVPIRMCTDMADRKPTEKSVTEFCYKSVNSSLEELKNNTGLLFPKQELFRWPNFPKKCRNKPLFNQLGRHVDTASRKSLEIQA